MGSASPHFPRYSLVAKFLKTYDCVYMLLFQMKNLVYFPIRKTYVNPLVIRLVN